MSTSGSINFSLNAREVCTYALEELREIGSGQEPDADAMAKVMRRLNLMLKSWQATGPNLWRQTDGSVSLVANTASYALSPRPFRVIEARYRSAAGVDIPMFDLTRQEYLDLSLKTSSGVPTNYYVDYQRGSAVLYVWSVPASVTTETIQYSYQRVFEDIDRLNDDLDIPQEYLELVGTSLAVRCFSLFGRSDKELRLREQQLMSDFLDADREDMVRFVPDEVRR